MGLEETKKILMILQDKIEYKLQFEIDEKLKEYSEAIDTAIRELVALQNLLDEYRYDFKKQEETIEKLQSHRQADYMVHQYDVKMIDQVKGECVSLYKENKKLEEMIDLIIDAWRQDDVRSKKEIKEYFKKKVGLE